MHIIIFGLRTFKQLSQGSWAVICAVFAGHPRRIASHRVPQKLHYKRVRSESLLDLRVVSLKKVQQLYCNWKPRVLGLLSCSYSWFLFSYYYLTFSSFLHFALFLFFWSVPGFLGGVPGFLGGVSGFLGGVPGFLWVFLVFLGMLLVSSGCSGFFGWCSWFFWVFRDVPGCSGVPCSGVPGSTTCLNTQVWTEIILQIKKYKNRLT